MTVQDVANLTLTVGAPGISREGFGINAILVPSMPETIDPISVWNAATVDADMAAAGLPVQHPARRWAGAIRAQPNKPPTLKVISANDSTSQRTVTLDMTGNLPQVGQPVRLTIRRGAAASADVIEHTVGSGNTKATVLGALETAIDALAGVEASVAGDVLTIQSSAADGSFFAAQIDQTVNPHLWTFNDNTTAAANIAEALTAAEALDGDWYGLVAAHSAHAELLAISEWAEANGKLFAAQSADSDVAQSGSADIASALMATNRGRTIMTHHPVHGDPFSAGLSSQILANDPGTIHWVYKQVTGSATPVYTPTQANILGNTRTEGKRVTYAIGARGRTATRGGRVVGGEWTDVVRLLDFFRARIPEDLYLNQLSLPRIPYTQGGIDSQASIVEARLLSKQGSGIVAGSVEVNPPSIADITNDTRRTRILSGMTFNAELEGAILLTNISGTFA